MSIEIPPTEVDAYRRLISATIARHKKLDRLRNRIASLKSFDHPQLTALITALHQAHRALERADTRMTDEQLASLEKGVEGAEHLSNFISATEADRALEKVKSLLNGGAA